MATLELVSHALCPYVQRAAISLSEKDVAFTRTDIDLANRPDWFRALSPLGKVPLLRVGDATVFESAVILEYLEDTQAAPLHPADPLARARHRAWIEVGSALLNDIWAFYTADAASFEQRRLALRARFEYVEASLGEGPWFDGARFSLVDVVFGPVFRYWVVFDAIGDFGIFDGLPKVQAWRAALAARPSVQRAVGPDYAQRLRAFVVQQNGHLAALAKAAA